MFSVLLCEPGKYQDVINENNDKVIQIFTEDILHQVHEIRRAVGNAETHYQKLVRSPMHSESSFRNISPSL